MVKESGEKRGMKKFGINLSSRFKNKKSLKIKIKN